MDHFSLPIAHPVPVFALILFLILFSTTFLKRIGVPEIVWLILSGVAVGPHGFGLLEKNSAVDLFSTIGLLYIMFIAGLELDLNQFKRYRNRSGGFGVLTFAIPLLIGLPVCFYVLDYGLAASLLTASMFATHTLVSYPMASKIGVARNEAVAITVGGTILTDTAVLLLLAFIVGSQSGNISPLFLVKFLASLAVLFVVLIYVVPMVARWFFRSVEGEQYSHYVFVLLVVFMGGFFAELAGVEAIIGAFLAGLSLNRLIPNSSPLMHRIEFIGNSLFIPFFLISVGMLVDLSVLFAGLRAWYVAGLLSAVALAGKWLAAAATQLLYGYSRAQRDLIFGLSSAHAAATLAVIIVGYRAEILDEYILNGTIILILITCIVASFATESSSHKVLLEQANSEPSTAGTSSRGHFLVPIANLNNLERLLNFVGYLRKNDSEDKVTLLTVVSNDEEAESRINAARKKLKPAVAESSIGTANVQMQSAIDHHAASGIERAAREVLADFIVLGWPHRRGLVDRILGTLVQDLLERSEKPILLCFLSRPVSTHERIVIAVEEEAERERSFKIALYRMFRMAQHLSIPIIVYGRPGLNSSIQNYLQDTDLSPLNLAVREAESLESVAGQLESSDLFVSFSHRIRTPGWTSTEYGNPDSIESSVGGHSRVIVFP